MEAENIDSLLERYLILLDEYTTLRSELGKLQSNMFQHLARANFSAERGMRYGPDFYDDRMQAIRRVEVSRDGSDTPTFKVGNTSPESGDEAKDDAAVSKPKDPLRWFGVLTPLPLRQAQGQAVQTIEQVIPRLASVNAEMEDIEIQVRRARKKRAKAEIAAKKEEVQAMKQEMASSMV